MNCSNVEPSGKPINANFVGSKYNWTIENLSSGLKKLNLISSSKFKDANNNEWVMSFKFDPQDYGDPNYPSPDDYDPSVVEINLMLVEINGHGYRLPAFVELFICQRQKGPCCIKDPDILDCKPLNFWIGSKQLVPFTCRVKYDKDNHELMERSTTVHCNIFVHAELQIPVSRDPVQVVWRDLLNDTAFSDVIIRSSGSSFPSYKALLSARSPVLKTLFHSNLTDLNENQLNFSEFSDPVVKGFLEHIYTDKTSIQSEHANEFLHISDMYEINGLKEDAENVIAEHLTLENAAASFHTAHMFNSKRLKTMVANFIKQSTNNAPLIQELAQLNPQLVAEIFAAIK